MPWVKKGIEEWQAAFEAAGFKNGIVAKEAPSASEDPDWSAEDVRYSVIRWLPSTTENANGPHVSDPRSGEILEADVNFYHNVMNLSRDWYWTQVGPLDPRAKPLHLQSRTCAYFRLCRFETGRERRQARPESRGRIGPRKSAIEVVDG